MVNKVKFYNNFNVSKAHKDSILLIGNFDGLHLGHQKLFKHANNYKKKFKLKIGIITFEPVPKMYFNKNIKNFRIFNLDQKKIFLKNQILILLLLKNLIKNFQKLNLINLLKIFYIKV